MALPLLWFGNLSGQGTWQLVVTPGHPIYLYGFHYMFSRHKLCFLKQSPKELCVPEASELRTRFPVFIWILPSHLFFQGSLRLGCFCSASSAEATAENAEVPPCGLFAKMETKLSKITNKPKALHTTDAGISISLSWRLLYPGLSCCSQLMSHNIKAALRIASFQGQAPICAPYPMSSSRLASATRMLK